MHSFRLIIRSECLILRVYKRVYTTHYIYICVRVCVRCRRHRRCRRRRQEMGREINKKKNSCNNIRAAAILYIIMYTTPGQTRCGAGLEGRKGSIAAVAHNVCTAEG